MKRHKCTAERQKPVSQQRGAVQCGTCHKWFRSKGGLAVHRCILHYRHNRNMAPFAPPLSGFAWP